MTTHARIVNLAVAIVALAAAASLAGSASATDNPPQGAGSCDYCGSFTDEAARKQVATSYEPLSGYAVNVARSTTSGAIAMSRSKSERASACSTASTCDADISR